MAIAQLSIDLVAKLANFERDTKRVGELVGEIGKTATVAFATMTAGAGTALAVFDQLVKRAGDWQDIAEKTGGSAAGWASLAVAVGAAGGEMNAVAAASVKLTSNLTGVDDESKKAGAALAALGIPIEKFKQLKPEDQLEQVAQALAGFEDNAKKTEIAVALFGKTGADLLPVLKALGEEGARQYILTDEQIAQADEYADRQAKARAELGIYAQAIATQALPALTAFTGALSDTAKDLLGVSRETGKLAADKGVQNFAIGAVKALGFVVDAADGVVRIFTVTGKSLGALAAAAGAAATGQFGQVRAIFKALGGDIDAELNRTLFSDRLQKRLAEINAQAGGASTGGGGKPSIRFDGAVSNAATRAAKEEKQAIDESAQALARYVNTLQSAIDRTEELSEEQKAQRFLSSLGATGEIEQVRTLVTELARQIDAEKELTAVLQLKRNAAAAPGDAVNARNARFQALRDATPSARLDQQRAQLLELTEAFNEGALGDPASEAAQRSFNEIASAYLNLGDAVTKVDDSFQKLGATFASSLEDAIVQGKGLRGVIQGLGDDILRIAVRKTITEPLGGAVARMFEGFSFANLFGFEKGGVMTSGGPLPLRTYATGGIASSPQLALYGEGSMAEAYVPLPDGRRIPVALQGSGGGRPVVVNIYNSIGNIASQSDVVTGMKAVRAQIIGELSRQQRMGVSFA